MNKKFRLVISLALTLITLAVAGYFINGHRYLLRNLGRTSPLTLAIVFVLYLVMLVALVLIFSATLKLCDVKIGRRENVQLNIYSVFINFFVPGQGGPVFRGLYLKKRRGLKLAQYIIATLLYYFFYALVAIFLLLAGSRPWWQTVLLVVVAGLVGLGFLKFYSRRAKFKVSRLQLNIKTLGLVLAATAFQALVQIGIYFVELHSVNAHIHFAQVVSYTGAADLALFVGLTPGAIGIREAFLIFSRHLHHVSSANIVAANIIDRGVFLIFLAVLFILTISLHIKNRLAVDEAETAP
ncbi:MAG: lysylphosphatidylglycerol synthase transmembrane domain-containing protein [Candidatus Saccharimonadales bacterium]